MLRKESSWFSLAYAARRSGRWRLESGLLPQILIVFHVEILILLNFMQLAWTVLDGCEPLTHTFFESLLRHCEPRVRYFGGATEPL